MNYIVCTPSLIKNILKYSETLLGHIKIYENLDTADTLKLTVYF